MADYSQKKYKSQTWNILDFSLSLYVINIVHLLGESQATWALSFIENLKE
jgi:hypothetical protein